MTYIDVCGAPAASCICTEPPNHNGPHVCDNRNFLGGVCGGTWTGTWDEVDFTVITYPNVWPDEEAR